MNVAPAHGDEYREPGNTLRLLTQGHFHQDFDLEAATPFGNVENFLDHADGMRRADLRRDISLLMAASTTEGDRERAWLQYSSYDPRDDGLSVGQWFAMIIDALDRRR